MVLFLGFIGGLGMPEIIVIVLVLVIFFGAKRLPELAKGMGQGIKEFKKATREVNADDEDESPKIQEKTKDTDKSDS